MWCEWIAENEHMHWLIGVSVMHHFTYSFIYNVLLPAFILICHGNGTWATTMSSTGEKFRNKIVMSSRFPCFQLKWNNIIRDIEWTTRISHTDIFLPRHMPNLTLSSAFDLSCCALAKASTHFLAFPSVSLRSTPWCIPLYLLVPFLYLSIPVCTSLYPSCTLSILLRTTQLDPVSKTLRFHVIYLEHRSISIAIDLFDIWKTSTVVAGWACFVRYVSDYIRSRILRVCKKSTLWKYRES